jgi:HEAT repeat protein
MNSTPETPSTPSGPETDGRRDSSVVVQYFLLPLAIVAALVGIFLLFVWATGSPPTARDHLRTLQTGRFNQRWQAAFDLANQIRKGDAAAKDPALVPDLVKVFRSAAEQTEEDPRVRRYLVLALGNAGSPEAVPALLVAAGDPDAETRLYALWGLARLGASDGLARFREAIRSPDSSFRSVGAYGLGAVEGPEGTEELREALTDPAEQVRWNAALGLGRKGDSGGLDILEKLLDRTYLNRFKAMEPEERTGTILNALAVLKHLRASQLRGTVERLERSDPDPRVREAAKIWNSDPAP